MFTESEDLGWLSLAELKTSDLKERIEYRMKGPLIAASFISEMTWSTEERSFLFQGSAEAKANLPFAKKWRRFVSSTISLNAKTSRVAEHREWSESTEDVEVAWTESDDHLRLSRNSKTETKRNIALERRAAGEVMTVGSLIFAVRHHLGLNGALPVQSFFVAGAELYYLQLKIEPEDPVRSFEVIFQRVPDLQLPWSLPRGSRSERIHQLFLSWDPKTQQISSIRARVGKIGHVVAELVAPVTSNLGENSLLE